MHISKSFQLIVHFIFLQFYFLNSMGRCWSTCCSCRQDLNQILPCHDGILEKESEREQCSRSANLFDGFIKAIDSSLLDCIDIPSDCLFLHGNVVFSVNPIIILVFVEQRESWMEQ